MTVSPTAKVCGLMADLEQLPAAEETGKPV